MNDGSGMEEEKRDHYVYRAFDEDLTLLYVGCTKSIKRRWHAHLAQASKSTTGGEWTPYVYTA